MSVFVIVLSENVCYNGKKSRDNKGEMTDMQKIFKGIMPALVTPFEKDGVTVDENAARKLIDFLLGQGADGFYVLGSTGEGMLMSEEQRMRMCEIAVDEVKGRKPVICHVASMNFPEAVRLAKHAEKTGVDAISALPPLFFAYSQDDVFQYYKTLAGSTGLPFIVYNHVSAGGGMSADTVAKLFEIDNVTGVKWTLGNYYQLMLLKDKTHGEMNIINGPDETLLCGLSAGADAAIGTTYNVMLPWVKKIYNGFLEGNMAEAREYQQKVCGVIQKMFTVGVLPGVKAMCKMMGFDVGQASFPFTQVDDTMFAAFEKDLNSINWYGK